MSFGCTIGMVETIWEVEDAAAILAMVGERWSHNGAHRSGGNDGTQYNHYYAPAGYAVHAGLGSVD